jgi:UDP:flavonoid glycosyltransferase YjiC (YdhE family)
MRILVASGPGAGHALPLLPFVTALADRGDDVLLVVPPELEETARTTGQPYLLGAGPPAEELDPLWARFGAAPPAEAAVIANREIFGRLNTAAMLPAMQDAIAGWRPDAVLREPCEYASAITALRAGIPHLQVGISQAAIEASATELVAPALAPYGDDVVPGLLAAPYLTRFPALLDPSPYTHTWRYRESAPAPGQPLPDWWSGRDGPLVYVTFGSVAGSLPVVRSVFDTALVAVAELDARVLVTVGRDVDIATFGSIAANTHLEAWVPQQDVLPDAALVVCHGGSGTTFGALAAGVPLVFVPMFADQRPNAERVEELGAGIVVAPPVGPDGGMAGLAAADAPRLREAIEVVLADGSYASAAAAVADDMAAAPPISGLLDQLARLVS